MYNHFRDTFTDAHNNVFEVQDVVKSWACSNDSARWSVVVHQRPVVGAGAAKTILHRVVACRASHLREKVV
jgi:hypothetical protein